MRRLGTFVWVVTGLLTFTGCTTTTIRVDRVLNAPSRQLKDNSPAGRKVLVAIRSLRDFGEALDTLRQQIDRLPDSLPATNTNARKNLADYYQAPLQDLGSHQDKIQDQIGAFRAFFENSDATGLAPRIDWEVAKTIMLLDEQKRWLRGFIDTVSGAHVPAVKAALRVSGGFQADLGKLAIACSNLVAQADLVIATTAQQGFGGFQTIGVSEVNASDPDYQTILNSGFAHLSSEPITEASSTITGSSQTIIVQESPVQFRTYQISNDPTALVKSISLLVSKATAAAAKYMSGGIAP